MLPWTYISLPEKKKWVLRSRDDRTEQANLSTVQHRDSRRARVEQVADARRDRKASVGDLLGDGEVVVERRGRGQVWAIHTVDRKIVARISGALRIARVDARFTAVVLEEVLYIRRPANDIDAVEQTEARGMGPGGAEVPHPFGRACFAIVGLDLRRRQKLEIFIQLPGHLGT